MRNGDLFWDHQNAVYLRRCQYSRNSEQPWNNGPRKWWFVLATQRESRDSALKTRKPVSCCVHGKLS